MLRAAGRVMSTSLASFAPLSTKTGEFMTQQPKATTVLDPKRAKGISKKLLLRAINRNLVARVAKRASIGIPVLGLYLVQRLFRNDLKQAFDPINPQDIRMWYGLVASVDFVDLLAQTTMITCLSSSLFLQDVSFLQDIDVQEVLKYADRTSLGAAFTSCTLGTYTEIKKQKV